MVYRGRLGMLWIAATALSIPLHASPKIGCAKTQFDFGVKESGTSVTGTFVINNDGDQPLQIGKLIPGCGCTSAKISANTIAPGGHATLTAQLSLVSQRGTLRKEVTIESNDPNTPKYQVYLVGKAVEPISVTPAEGVFFGAIDAHAGEGRAIDLVAPTPDKAFTIREILVGDKESVKTRYEEVTKNMAYRVYVTLAKDLTPGDFHSWVHVRTTNLKFPVIALPITASVTGELAVAPSDVRVFYPKDQDGATRYISVSAGKVKTFQVTGVETPSPAIKAQIIPQGNGFRVKLTGLTPEKELDRASIVIKTNVPEMAAFRIPIHVINTGHPPVSTQPAQNPAATQPAGARR